MRAVLFISDVTASLDDVSIIMGHSTGFQDVNYYHTLLLHPPLLPLQTLIWSMMIARHLFETNCR